MTQEERKDAILQKQMEMAMEGNVEMLKWLGIQYCGQSSQPTRDDELPTAVRGFVQRGARGNQDFVCRAAISSISIPLPIAGEFCPMQNPLWLYGGTVNCNAV